MNIKINHYLKLFFVCLFLTATSLLNAQCNGGVVPDCTGMNTSTGCCYVYDALGNLENCANSSCSNCIGIQAPPGGYECWEPSVNCNLCLLSLPVELLSFTVEASEFGNIIRWQTSAEDNAMLFSIERSADGKESWEEIGKVQPIGFSTSIQSYSLKDRAPLKLGYYRLRVTDFDGQYELFDVVAMDRNDDNGGSLRLYPNPIKDEALAVYFSLDRPSKVIIHLIDAAGKVIYSERSDGHEGVNQRSIDLQNSLPGIYFVRLQTNNGRQTVRLVKANS
ncbi:MAG: T9SS type A sorting domain-containing protein [Bacteroidota bacterium]